MPWSVQVARLDDALSIAASATKFRDGGGLCPSQCLIWNPDCSGVRLWPSVVFLPKVLATTYVNQPIKLAYFNLPSGDEGSPLLCLVRALRVCTDATASSSSAMVVQEVEVLCPSSGCPTGLWIPLGMPT